jgi:hypothetical protein
MTAIRPHWARSIGRRALAGALAAALALGGGAAAAQDFATSGPERGKFVVEYVYNYVSRHYVRPVQVVPVDAGAADYSSPERAAIAHFSAMRAGDYDWWLSGWDAASQAQIEARNAELGRTADDWAGIWAKAMKGESVFLLERVETGPYVFIVYEMRNADGEVTLRSIYACKRVGGEWRATQDLAQDPMFHHYLKGKQRVILNVR